MTDNTASPGQASRRATLGLLGLILLLLGWYLLADRLTPYNSQARVQAFVVPIAAEVSGKIQKVHVRDNQDVEVGGEGGEFEVRRIEDARRLRGVQAQAARPLLDFACQSNVFWARPVSLARRESIRGPISTLS